MPSERFLLPSSRLLWVYNIVLRRRMASVLCVCVRAHSFSFVEQVLRTRIHRNPAGIQLYAGFGIVCVRARGNAFCFIMCASFGSASPVYMYYMFPIVWFFVCFSSSFIWFFFLLLFRFILSSSSYLFFCFGTACVCIYVNIVCVRVAASLLLLFVDSSLVVAAAVVVVVVVVVVHRSPIELKNYRNI